MSALSLDLVVFFTWAIFSPTTYKLKDTLRDVSLLICNNSVKNKLTRSGDAYDTMITHLRTRLQLTDLLKDSDADKLGRVV